MMNMGMDPGNNQMLMQRLMQLRQQGNNGAGAMTQGMPQGGGNPNVGAMPQMGGMPTQNPAQPMQNSGMQSMAPQDPMMARKLMMMKMQGGMGGGNMGDPSRSMPSNSDGMILNRMG